MWVCDKMWNTYQWCHQFVLERRTTVSTVLRPLSWSYVCCSRFEVCWPRHWFPYMGISQSSEYQMSLPSSDYCMPTLSPDYPKTQLALNTSHADKIALCRYSKLTWLKKSNIIAVNRMLVGFFSSLGLAPKGMRDVHEMLVNVAQSLSAGGETGVSLRPPL